MRPLDPQMVSSLHRHKHHRDALMGAFILGRSVSMQLVTKVTRGAVCRNLTTNERNNHSDELVQLKRYHVVMECKQGPNQARPTFSLKSLSSWFMVKVTRFGNATMILSSSSRWNTHWSLLHIAHARTLPCTCCNT